MWFNPHGLGLIMVLLSSGLLFWPISLNSHGPRYVATTGEHLLEGYRRVGKWAFSLFLVLSLLTMFPIQAAVTMVATGLIANLINWPASLVILSAIILFICASILLIGRYPLLDKSMKVMVLVLALSTVIAFAAAVTMFSMTLSCFDAFPRIIREASLIMFPSAKIHADKIYFGWMMVVAAGSLLIIGCFVNSMKILIDVATTMSFLAAPVFAYINYHTVTDAHVPEEVRPSKALRIFSWVGIVFLSGFSILFIVWRFFLAN